MRRVLYKFRKKMKINQWVKTRKKANYRLKKMDG